MVEKSEKAGHSINMRALEGLRGLAGLHIMISHFYFSSPLETPLFYTLSGFYMAVAYGQATQRAYKSVEEGGDEEKQNICKKSSQAQKEEEEGMVRKSLRFYRNRLARILPMFYLSNIAQILLNVYSCIHVFNGVKFFLKMFFTLTATNCWFDFLFLNPADISPFNGVSWTMSTITFFYLLFPLLLPLLQGLSSSQLRALVVFMYHFQLIFTLFFIWDHPGLLSISHKKNPLGRLPVFMMGMASGLLRIRHQSEIQGHCNQDGQPMNQDGGLNKKVEQNQEGGLNPSKNFLHDLLPWGICGGGGDVLMRVEERQKSWRWKVDRNAAVLLLAILVLHYYPKTRPYGHFFSPHTQLMVIYGLTQDGQKSFVSMVCRWRITRLLGNISMTTWLLHFPIRHFLLLLLDHPDCNQELQELTFKRWWSVRTENPPDWLSPLLIPIVLFVSFWVNKWFEQPMRDWLRTKNVKK